LVVDDDPAVQTVLAGLLAQAGIPTEVASSGEAALARLAERPFEVVLADVRMPGMGGLALCKEVRVRWPETAVVVLTAHGTVPMAVEAMKLGAAEFMLKPFDRDELLYAVRKAAQSVAHVAAHAQAPVAITGLVGGSPPMRELAALLTRVARTDATVLIRGETGTGKELAARALHAQSDRAKRPFVAVHCASLPDNLLESELFGYERGAFTGAAMRKPGRLELAEGGTVFLDEIGEISPQTQVKLLRVVQERTYERLGGTQTLRADIRLVAATHRNLEEMVRAGQFREDLYYRLAVVPVEMPPLRARGDDVRALAMHFFQQLAALHRRPTMRIEAAALEKLAKGAWPGNVRQLQNFIERLVVLCPRDEVQLADVTREWERATPIANGDRPAAEGAPVRLDESRARSERAAIEEALSRASQNRTLAARLLGISRRTLYNKLAELEIA
jgi:DNA-binding NtrC family response regulator